MTVVAAGYLLVVVLQLYGCFTQHQQIQRWTKPFLMPLLYGVVVSYGGTLPLWAGLGLLFGYLGDLFLMREKEDRFLLLGIGSFGLGHLFYTVALFQKTAGGVSFQDFLLPFALAFFFGVIQYRQLRKYLPDQMKLPVMGYIGIILLMWISGAVGFFQQQTTVTTVAFVGATLFILSDLILAYELFRGESRYGYFYVMLFYIGAQTLLVYALHQ